MSVEGKGISMFDIIRDTGELFWVRPYNQCKCEVNPKRCGLLGGILFREMKFVLSNFLSSEDLSISYES